MNLRRRLAEHGFESNDDYDHALRCVFEQQVDHLRVLHVDGAAGRRKTAFAQALGGALGFEHVLYHDFSINEVTPAVLVAPQTVTTPDCAVTAEPPLIGIERVMIEACAYSEAARTLLILDQLQTAHFAEQNRLYRFVTSGEWQSPGGSALAHTMNFLLVLISEQPLYHSLAKCSFRIWTDAQRAFLDYRPIDFGLGHEAQGLFDALAQVCEIIRAAPTPTEFSLLLQDLLQRAHSEEQIRQSLFGRIETIDRAFLYGPELASPLHRVSAEIERLLLAERIELGGLDSS